jgi:uncharacterized protein (TIGR02646 family)
MRRIEKRREPVELSQWRSANAGTPNCSYRHLSGDAHSAVKTSLLAEQGRLCAYTGHRIGSDSCHIEHLKPQHHCTDDESVDYQNLVACYPLNGHPGYGAKQKDNWPSTQEEAALFVSPLSNDCESRFSFSASGRISASNPADSAALETIRRLKLDHSTLQKFRREASDPIKLLSIKAARNRLADLGRETALLTPFCFAVKQVLLKHIHLLESIRDSRLS